MSTIRPGTLVMLKSGYNNPPRPVSGAIGEVQDTSGKNDLWSILAGYVAVSFPRNPSPHITGYWQYPCGDLIPISGGDLVSDEDVLDNPYVVKKPVEDLV